MKGCRKMPCTYKAGSQIKMRAYFIPMKKNIDNLDLKFSLDSLIKIPMPGMQRNGCTYGENLCPLKFNQINNFNVTVNVSTFAPRVYFYLI